MRISALEIEDQKITLPPHSARQCVGPHTLAVVVDIIFERDPLFLADGSLNQMQHGAAIALEQFVHSRLNGIDAETSTELQKALFRQAHRRHKSVKIAMIPLWLAALVQNHLEYIILQDIILVDLDDRDDHAFLVNLRRIGRQGTRHFAANIGHMSKHRGISDQTALKKYRPHHQPVRRMTNCARAAIRVRGQKYVTFFNGAVIVSVKAVNERAELANHHLAVRRGNHWKFIMLLTNARRHGGAVKHGVHLITCTPKSALDDIEGDGINIDFFEGLAIRLNDFGWHDDTPRR